MALPVYCYEDLRRPLNRKKIGECNPRIEELAQPKRWRLLGTYKSFAYLLEPTRMQAMKERVQELFSMSPEETELYFSTLRLKKPKRIDYKTLRLKMRREKMQARKEAYRLFHRLLKKAMKYAYKHASPLLVTPMLRIMSDHVLEILAELHKVHLPKRSDPDNLSQFLISIADWTAILVANIYYEIEVAERDEIAENEKLNKLKSITSTQQTETEKATTMYSDRGEAAEDEEEEGEGIEVVSTVPDTELENIIAEMPDEE